MAKQSFHIVNKNNKRVGVLFLDIPATSPAMATLESVAPNFQNDDYPEQIITEDRQLSFWASDGITYALAGAFAGSVVGAYSWWYELNGGLVVATITLLAGVGLHVLKIILHAPPKIKQSKVETTTIKVETWEDDNKHTLLQEIEDDRIALDELKKVGRAYQEGTPFARDPMSKAAKISKTKYRVILAEMQRLNFAHIAPNNKVILSLRGKAFLRKLAALP